MSDQDHTRPGDVEERHSFSGERQRPGLHPRRRATLYKFYRLHIYWGVLYHVPRSGHGPSCLSAALVELC